MIAIIVMIYQRFGTKSIEDSQMKKIKNILQYHLILWFILLQLCLFAGNNIFPRLVLQNEIYLTICRYFPIMVYLPKFALLAVLFIIWWFYTLEIFYRHKTLRKWLFLNDRHQYRGYSYIDLIKLLNVKRSDPERLLEDDLEFLKPWECDGIPFGMIGSFLAYRKTKDKGNVLCVGMPGSGKTNFLAIPTAVQFGKRTPAHIFCIDIKGDILENVGDKRNVKKFVPHDHKSSCCFDAFRVVRGKDEDTQIEFFTNLALMLIEDDPHSSQYFTKGGRDIFIACCLYALKSNANSTLHDIAVLLRSNDYDSLVDLIAESGNETAYNFVREYENQKSSDVAGCYSHAVSGTQLFAQKRMKYLLACDSGYESIDEFKNKTLEDINNMIPMSADDFENGYDIFLEIREDDLKQLAPLVSLIVDSFALELLSRENGIEGSNTPILMLLDEFASFNRMQNVLELQAKGRSKSCTVMILCQSFDQLYLHYSDHEVQTMVDNSPYKCVLSASGATAKYFSEMAGNIKTLTTSANEAQGDFSRSTKSASEKEEPFITPTALGNLHEKEEMLLIYNGKHARVKLMPFYKWPASQRH